MPGWEAKACLGLAVAGNVAGHMAQAGEAEKTAPAGKTPAGCFIFYNPHPEYTGDDALREQLDRLSVFPVNNSKIDYPRDLEGATNVQVEPELALFCLVMYSEDEDGKKVVSELVPMKVAAFNDCSIRKLPDSVKLSEKKNWGAHSKGISRHSFPVTDFSKGGPADRFMISSYLKRAGETFPYTVPAYAKNYTMYNQELLDWIVTRMNGQRSECKWDDLPELIAASGYPDQAWIALGAGEYTEWGETNFLQPEDQAVVMVHDSELLPDGPTQEQIAECFDNKCESDVPGFVALHQEVV